MNKLAFWNVYKKLDYDLVTALCVEHHLDILVLAEIGEVAPLTIANEISQRGTRVFSYCNPQSFRIKIYGALGSSTVTPLMDHHYFSAVKVQTPLGPEFMLIGLHLPSKMNQETDDQTIIAQRVSSQIRNLEVLHGIRKTVVIGDFNMNPFEHGMVNSDGFHAVMDKRIAERGKRTVLFDEHPFFYNPMWALQGDIGIGPPGSFFQQRSSPLCYFWNLFDQAIFRPELLRYLTDSPVRVVEEISGVSLLSDDGFPNHEISDHLPIVVSFKSNNEV